MTSNIIGNSSQIKLEFEDINRIIIDSKVLIKEELDVKLEETDNEDILQEYIVPNTNVNDMEHDVEFVNVNSCLTFTEEANDIETQQYGCSFLLNNEDEYVYNQKVTDAHISDENLHTHDEQNPLETNPTYSQNNTPPHMQNHNEKKQYECNYCNKSFFKGGCLKLHLQTHIEENTYGCKICGTKFNTSRGVAAHMQTHNKSRFVCNICNKNFIKSTNFSLHMQTHLGIKHECDICKKQFVEQKYMLRHKLLAHSGELYNFKCLVCEQKFARLASLKVHMQNRCGKIYECKTCKMAFSDLNKLQTHKNINCRKYKCEKCHKEFTRRNYLSTHKQIHFWKKEL